MQRNSYTKGIITILVFIFSCIIEQAFCSVAYLRSNTAAPWGQSTNEAAMNGVFGIGNWQDLRFETANPATLFTTSTTFIFMEGSDNNALELKTFLTANQTAIENWVFM